MHQNSAPVSPDTGLQNRTFFYHQFRSTVSRCSLLLLLTAVVANGSAFLISELFHSMIQKGAALPFSLDTANFLIAYFPCLAADLLAILLGVFLLRPNLKEVSFRKSAAPKRFTALAVLACLGLGNLAALIYLVYSSFIQSMGGSFAQPDIAGFSDPAAMTMLLLYLCVLGPVCEEILFRGVILKSLQRFGEMSAILITSILFAMFHMNLVQLPAPILLGLLLGYTAVRTKSIYPAILIHIVNNTLMGAPGLFYSEDNPVSLAVLSAVSVFSLFVGGGSLIYFLIRYGKDFFSLRRWENAGTAPVRSKLGRLFTSAGFLIYLVFYIGFIVISSVLSAS